MNSILLCIMNVFICFAGVQGLRVESSAAGAEPLFVRKPDGSTLKIHIADQIGQGAMGTVFSGTTVGEDKPRKVAIKIFGEHCGHYSKSDFELEKDNSSSISPHANICSYYGGDWFDHENNLLQRGYLVFEKLDMSIADFLEKQQSIEMSFADKLRQAQYLFASIVLAVHHMHDQGFTHRDLKPHNIVMNVTNDGMPTFKMNDVKVIDLGTATTAQTFAGLESGG